jgi:hypothetical protein
MIYKISAMFAMKKPTLKKFLLKKKCAFNKIYYYLIIGKKSLLNQYESESNILHINIIFHS